MFAYITLSTENGEIELSALVNIEDNSVLKDTISITFKELKDPEFKTIELSWDAPPFIFKEFRAYLVNFLGRSLSKKRIEDVEEVHQYFFEKENDGLAKECLEMLDYAIKHNWY